MVFYWLVAINQNLAGELNDSHLQRTERVRASGCLGRKVIIFGK